MTPTLRPAVPADQPLLAAMLLEAAFWRDPEQRPSPADLVDDPELGRYVEKWGRAGDVGFIAERGGKPIGAVWLRRFTSDVPGYGFVDRTVPELSMAVARPCRGAGVGTALLRAILREARERGIEGLSLSVERDNPAVALYERFGFAQAHCVGNSWTMVVDPERATR